MKEETTIDTNNSTAKIDFSKFVLDKLYIIQEETIAKLQLRKNDIANLAVK